jgi:hypothetical protein
MPGADSTTKAEVLLRAARLLEARLPDFANRIHVVIEDDIPNSAQNNEILTVMITGGSFDEGALTGGGSSVVHYRGTLRVAVWSHNRADRPGVSLSMLTASGRGLLRLQTKIIKALTGSYLQESEAGGNGYTPQLIDCIKPMSDSQPQSAGKDGASSQKATLAVDFSVDFKWDLDGDINGEPE